MIDRYQARPLSRASRLAPVLQSPRTQFLFQFLLLVLISALMFFSRLGTPLLEPEEARYAEIPRQMLAEGNFLVPVLHGEPYYHKPPLLYWLVMASYQVFGVHDWAARLVPGGCGVLLVLLLYLWGRRILGDHAAFLAALILCLSARFIYLGRMLTLDVLLCLFVVAALLSGYRGLTDTQNRRRWWIISAICCGLGLLTKGPVALALVGVPLLVFPWLDARATRPNLRAWACYVAIAVGIAAPWYAAMAVDNWDAAVTFFWLHNVTRYVAPFDHAKPFWFFLPSLFLGMLPWSLLLFPMARYLINKGRAKAPERPPALGFFLLAFCWCVFFFSCSGCKRAVYILPALPLLAAALGCYLASAIPWRNISLPPLPVVRLPAQGTTWAFLLTAGILFVGLTGCLLAASQGFLDSSEGLFAAAFFSALLITVCSCGSRLTAPAAWGTCVVMLFLLEFGAVYHLLPEYNRRFGLRGQVRRYLEWCDHQRLAVVCYPRRWDSVSFYLKNNEVQAFTPEKLRQMMEELQSEPASLVFIKSDRSLTEFLAALPPSLDFRPCGRQGKNVQVGLVQNRHLPARAIVPAQQPLAGVKRRIPDTR